MNLRCAFALISIMFLAPVAAGHAQVGYPDKPVRIIVGFPGGTGTDVFARLFADNMSEQLKAHFYIENIPGAASNIASATAARAQPDGYTLFAATNANSIAVSLYKKLSYRFPDDFEPIAMLATTPQVLVVNPAMGINTMQDLISAAKSRPGELMYGSGGIGSGPHLAAEMLSLAANIKLSHVPYKGTTEALSDLLTGRISMMFSSMPIVRSYVDNGRLKVLAVATHKRMATEPDLPTIAETGLPGFEVVQWIGLMAPKGTPPAILNSLAAAVTIAQHNPELRKKIADNGGELPSATRDDFKQFILKDIPNWAKAVDHSGIKID
jgi:tripartite-type tricarboxylate transporter receptor subunit TctC